MDEWLRQLQASLDEAAQGSEKWLIEVIEETDQAVSQAAEAIGPVVIELHQQVEDSLDATEIFLSEHFTPWVETVTMPITHTITPYLQAHHACVGCEHYNGTAHGGNMLVCAMHPYGPEDETCQDWSSVWDSSIGR